MATIPDATRNAILAAYIAGKDIRLILIREGGTDTGPYYTGTPSDLQYLDEIPNNTDCRVGDVIALTTEQVVAMLFSSDSPVIVTNVPAHATDGIDAYLLYDHTGDEETSEIILYDNTATGFPFTPDGNNVEVTASSGWISSAGP